MVEPAKNVVSTNCGVRNEKIVGLENRLVEPPQNANFASAAKGQEVRSQREGVGQRPKMACFGPSCSAVERTEGSNEER